MKLLFNSFADHLNKLNDDCRDYCEKSDKCNLQACQHLNAEQRVHKRYKEYERKQEHTDKESGYAVEI